MANTVRSRTSRAGLLAALTLTLAAGCGGDGSAKAPTAAPSAKPTNASKTAAAMAPKTGPKGAIVTTDKVAEEYRRELTKADFMPDFSGDMNRDPFRIYLTSVPVAGTLTGPSVEDECEKRMVAGECTIGDLKLVGIVSRGTESYGLFVDGKGKGHKAKVGDCLSKDRVHIKSMSEGRIIGEMRGVAAPGQAAPPPVAKEWPLHPQDLRLEEQAVADETGGQ